MMTWILTSAVIAVLSVALLRLFDDEAGSDTSNVSLDERSRKSAPFAWETMTDAELDALVLEFAAGETPLMRKPI